MFEDHNIGLSQTPDYGKVGLNSDTQPQIFPVSERIAVITSINEELGNRIDKLFMQGRIVQENLRHIETMLGIQTSTNISADPKAIQNVIDYLDRFEKIQNNLSGGFVYGV